MNLIESRLLSLQVDEAGREIVLLLRETGGAKVAIQLHGVERFLITELREQNIVEEMTHWKAGQLTDGLRQAAFALIAGCTEEDCASQLASVAQEAIDRVTGGKVEMMEICSIFGAQILAMFASMTIAR